MTSKEAIVRRTFRSFGRDQNYLRLLDLVKIWFDQIRFMVLFCNDLLPYCNVFGVHFIALFDGSFYGNRRDHGMNRDFDKSDSSHSSIHLGSDSRFIFQKLFLLQF